MAAIFGSTLFFTTQIQKKHQAILEMQSLLEVKNTQIAENTTLQNSIHSLHQQLETYNASMALYDSLVPGSDRFSKAFSQMSHGVEDLNSLWVNEFVCQESGQASLNGFAVSRSRIPRLSALYGKPELKEVNTEEIRGETVYRYKIEIPSIDQVNQNLESAEKGKGN
jgi:hypothetical protein